MASRLGGTGPRAALGAWRQRVSVPSAVIAAILVGLILRIAWSMYAARSVPVFLVSGDQYSYWVIGQEIAAGRGYRVPDFDRPTSYYPVGFPAILGVIAWVTLRTPFPSDPVLVMAVVQIVAGVAAIALTYVIARRLWGDRVATIAAWIIAVWPNLVIASATYSVEPVFIALTLTSLAILVTHDWSAGLPSTQRLIAFGLVLGVTIQVRPFVAPVLLGLVLAGVVVRCGWRAIARIVAVPALVVLATMVPWTVRNAVVLDAFVPISTNLGDTVCLDRTLDANGTFRFAVHEGCASPDLFETERNPANLRRAASFVVQQPGKEVQLWGMRLYRMMENDRVALVEVEDLGDGAFLPATLRSGLGVVADLWFFAVGTFAVAGAARHRRALWATPERSIVLVTAGFLLLIPIGLWGAPRFHVPLAPFMAMGAALLFVSPSSVRPCVHRGAPRDVSSDDVATRVAAETAATGEPLA